MDHFTYKNDTLHAEDVAIPAIAAAVGTPFYVYSHATISRHFTVFDAAFEGIPHTICFAVKANSNLAVLKTLGNLGAGADTVSEGEIRRALAANIPANKIVFSGVGKTRAELRYALPLGIAQFNVESQEELRMLSQEAVKLDLTAPIAIRVNPDVEAGSHDHISTGRKTDKFGIPWQSIEQTYQLAASLPNINIVGVTTHIGSQLTDLEPFKQAFSRITNLVERLRQLGHSITTLDLGGGLGIPYETADQPPLPDTYGSMIKTTINHLGCHLILEPGRLIVGNAGILVASVALTKTTIHRKFLVLDAAMNDLMRPALYNAHHDIIPVIQPPAGTPNTAIDIVGPVCETTDRFAKARELPPLSEGDLVAFRSAGAYGAVMSNSYNSRLLIPEIMVQNDKFQTIRPRPSYQDLLNQDKIPNWL